MECRRCGRRCLIAAALELLRPCAAAQDLQALDAEGSAEGAGSAAAAIGGEGAAGGGRAAGEGRGSKRCICAIVAEVGGEGRCCSWWGALCVWLRACIRVCVYLCVLACICMW